MTYADLPAHAPEVGQLVHLRQRTWLVDAVTPPDVPGQSCRVLLACADDDAQGQSLEVLWEYELDRQILQAESWANLARRGFDSPDRFAAFLHTLRWSCVTATDPILFQSPFGAGIKSTPTRWSRCVRRCGCRGSICLSPMTLAWARRSRPA